VAPAPVAARTDRTVVQERPRRTLIPAFGRKGGERVEEHRVDEVRETQVDRRP
jgi:hypothetical protein